LQSSPSCQGGGGEKSGASSFEKKRGTVLKRGERGHRKKVQKETYDVVTGGGREKESRKGTHSCRPKEDTPETNESP